MVDDDAPLREVVRYALARDSFDVVEASDGHEALAGFEAHAPDLVVLDINMPGLDGLAVCREIRRRSATPILFLSCRGDEVDRVVGLDLGGDDYVTKPFSPRELVSRVKAILRRGVRPAEVEPDVVVGALRLSPKTHQATANGRDVRLTATEFRLLAAMMRGRARVLDRAELARAAYVDGRRVSERTVDSHVRRIRAKLRPHGLDPIETVHGVGLRLRDAMEV
ncbi:MAG: response regulator transcription factor [Myxococcota bacterium]